MIFFDGLVIALCFTVFGALAGSGTGVLADVKPMGYYEHYDDAYRPPKPPTVLEIENGGIRPYEREGLVMLQCGEKVCVR